MRLLVAGLPPREEAALGFFLDRSFKSWVWQSAVPDVQAVRPPADLIVIDMAAFGWAHWSESSEAQLLAWLQGTPAVLLVSAHDRSWSVVQDRSGRASMVWLPKPYGTQAMREALDRVADVAQTAPAVPPKPISAPVSASASSAVSHAAAAPVLARTQAALKPIKAELARPVLVKAEPARVEASSDAPSLSIAAFQARLALQPENTPHVFLRVLSDMLRQPLAFEARFTVQNSLIIHPSNDWMATNTPLQVIYRLCESDAMASAVTVRTLDDAQAEERAQRLGMPPQDLEAFLWNLVAATLDKRATAT